MKLLDNFKLAGEKEGFDVVAENLEKGTEFKGTNLWILVFAIFIASLGLNVNSPAVIIGAMLISPLMGPIMGLGFGMAINDLSLLRKSLISYLFASGVSLAASTIYFFISPLNEAHSEILARTAPNIYDVLIALFGGLAGMLVTSSKLKGNVIPGVAIATALMPPLCTAGYGLATLKFDFFVGALYLFFINTVFIALATLFTTRILKFPFKHLPKLEDEIKAKRIVWAIVTITILPSIYFGYDVIQKNKFTENANRFIAREANFANDYLLKASVDPKSKTISLVFGGAPIDENQIHLLNSKLIDYNIGEAHLDVKQGFAYLQTHNETQTDQLSRALHEKILELQSVQKQVDSIKDQSSLSLQLFNELKAQHNDIKAISCQQAFYVSENNEGKIWIAFISFGKPKTKTEKSKIERWLKARLKTDHIKIQFE